MQTDALREFLAVANRLNFSSVADDLHLSRSSLSKHITALENELGFQLFDRAAGVELTKSGAAFYRYAQEALNCLDEGRRKGLEIAQELQPVRIVWNLVDDDFFSTALSGFRTPLVLLPPSTNNLSTVEVLNMGYADVVPLFSWDWERARSGMGASGKHLGFVPIGTTTLVVLMGRENPLAGTSALTREDMRGQKILLGYGAFFEDLRPFLVELLGHEAQFHIVQDAQMRTWVDLLDVNFESACYITFRSLALAVCERRDDVFFFDELDGEQIVCSVGLMFRDDSPNRNVHAFVQEARTIFATGSAPLE